MRTESPLAISVGDRLVSISTPGRAPLMCGPTVTGLDITDELRAGASGGDRVLTFAARNFAMASAPPAPVSIAPPVPHAGPSLLNARWDTFDVEALPGRLGVRFDTGTSHRVMGVSASSPLAGRVTVGDELVRIKSLGSSFELACGDQVNGHQIVDWLRAFGGSRKTLTFARGDGFAYQRFATLSRATSVSNPTPYYNRGLLYIILAPNPSYFKSY